MFKNKNKNYMLFNFYELENLIKEEGLKKYKKTKAKLFKLLKKLSKEKFEVRNIKSINNLFFYGLKTFESEIFESFVEKLKETIEENFKNNDIKIAIIYSVNTTKKLSFEKCYVESVNLTEVSEDVKSIIYKEQDDELWERLKKEETLLKNLKKLKKEGSGGVLYTEFQPIINIDDEKIDSFESLARYKDNRLGNIPPDIFIPIMEKNNLIIHFGEEIINQSFAFLKKIEDKKVKVFINISLKQLLSEDFVKMVKQKIKQHEIKANKIIFEITESITCDNFPKVENILEKLTNLGIKFAIDDFGKGDSTFSKQNKFNVDIVKIDRSFTQNITTEEGEKYFKNLVELFNNLGKKVIIEGVETHEEKEKIVKNGGKFVQGFLYSKPISEKDAEKLLKKEG